MIEFWANMKMYCSGPNYVCDQLAPGQAIAHIELTGQEIEAEILQADGFQDSDDLLVEIC